MAELGFLHFSPKRGAQSDNIELKLLNSRSHSHDLEYNSMPCQNLICFHFIFRSRLNPKRKPRRGGLECGVVSDDFYYKIWKKAFRYVVNLGNVCIDFISDHSVSTAISDRFKSSQQCDIS